MIGIPNQHQRGTQTTRGAIASGFKSALACVVGVTSSYDPQHDTRLRAGGFFLATNLAGLRLRLFSHSHRRVSPSLSRRYWHGVQRQSLGSAVPFLIRGAFHRSRFNTKPEHRVTYQASDAPKHFNRVLSSWGSNRWVQPSDGAFHGAGKRRHVLGQISQGSRDV